MVRMTQILFHVRAISGAWVSSEAADFILNSEPCSWLKRKHRVSEGRWRAEGHTGR